MWFDSNCFFYQPMLRGACSCVQPHQGIRCLYKHRMSVDNDSGKKINNWAPLESNFTHVRYLPKTHVLAIKWHQPKFVLIW